MDLAKLQRHEKKNRSRPLKEILIVFNVAKFLAHFQVPKRPLRLQEGEKPHLLLGSGVSLHRQAAE
jgi:hypothetical protein